MAKQIKKYMAVTTASLMAVQLAACGNSETQTTEEYPLATSNHVTEDQNQAITSDEIESVYNSEIADACDEWQEGDDGSFECIDENSPYYAQHFFNGLMYATAGAMIGSAIYKSRNLKNGTDRHEQSNGGGSAVPRSSTNAKDESKPTNGITNSTQNKASSTSGSSTPSGSNSYSSGQRSYSTDSSSKSSNSYSNSSSSSTGKSGFGSGGASRGGSSSS
ncbi:MULTISPECIES: hypothetical protein [Lysinibacillus]|uniref:hypothetical protein n=1 Tax=Lysinibacillus TaxID=400634 RepID=UPI00214B1D5C|nr:MULTISPECIES: hypothetical protein [Lysinibacillus]UNT54417.1 hypothetical protein ICJ70_18105 [Lysinibacillus capsici]UUV25700.1 hypothetical protein NP781_03530 [Lysinibacillus sp. FN11]UYB48575.1 hypothetical protein OCI51_06335 [Lysinibacillus capsici]WHP39367.1 hypothetical protein QIX46_12290 [Lysinibacillus boronitolerans]